jgi:death-on-curing protein
MSGASALDAREVLFLHYRIIERTGGEHGVRDLDMLKAALARPLLAREGKDIYPTLHDKAGVLLHALAAGAPFKEGNRRTALAATALMLMRGGLELVVGRVEAGETMRRLAQGELNFRDAAAWLRDHCRPDPAARPA